MTEAEQVQAPTVRSRMLAGGMSPERIALHHEAGRFRLDGEVVEDLDQPTPPDSRIVIARA